MKYIFTILSLLFLPSLSLKVLKPKFCVNCKYFITNNKTQFGKCSLFPKIENNNHWLVNGIYEDKINEYHYCNVVRGIENMCGPEAKMYKKKYIKKSI
jgi:hypothetical protein